MARRVRVRPVGALERLPERVHGGREVRELIESGNYRAVIDRRYRLEDVVEATRYVETQQKTGNVVLTVGAERSQPPRALTHSVD